MPPQIGGALLARATGTGSSPSSDSIASLRIIFPLNSYVLYKADSSLFTAVLVDGGHVLLSVKASFYHLHPCLTFFFTNAFYLSILFVSLLISILSLSNSSLTLSYLLSPFYICS